MEPRLTGDRVVFRVDGLVQDVCESATEPRDFIA
jgi:hypothetical protein